MPPPRTLLAAIPLALIVGCGSSSSSGKQAFTDPYSNAPQDSSTFSYSPPALAAPDPSATVDPPVTEAPPPVESAYDMALDEFATHCTQSRDFLAGMVPKVLADLNNNGVHDETLLTLTEHLTTSASGLSGRIDCVGVASAYAVLREPQ